MKISKKITIRQPFQYKFISILKRLISKFSLLKNIKKLERNQDSWYGIETANDLPFRWSHPIAKLNIKNLSKITMCISDPLGREITVISKGVNEKVKLDPEKIYEITVFVSDSEEVVIRTDPFNPEKDTRSLGLQYFYISSENTIILN